MLRFFITRIFSSNWFRLLPLKKWFDFTENMLLFYITEKMFMILFQFEGEWIEWILKLILLTMASSKSFMLSGINIDKWSQAHFQKFFNRSLFLKYLSLFNLFLSLRTYKFTLNIIGINSITNVAFPKKRYSAVNLNIPIVNITYSKLEYLFFKINWSNHALEVGIVKKNLANFEKMWQI